MVAMRFRPGGCFRFVVGRGVLLCCTVCVFFWALLVVPAAHGQVIEEGGFPVKGGSISGESFSLSCPSRVFAEAGESVLLSCTATGVPEEGVRYEWESLSGDGLHLLSGVQERSPLFTAPLSGAGAEYVYRLTAMSVGVYETATVTVVVGGASGGSVQDGSKSPVAMEDCDSFGVLAGFREGCVAGDKMPPSFEPFEGGPEDEAGPGFLFPEPFGIPEKGFPGSAGDRAPGLETAPRLECPSAVFLEELETGSIECYVSDAAGEEFLEYSWEPVGGTTRDYLDNPRLIPEDAPNPSVVAPEAPGFETLESFHSGETTFRYRYRLTVTSRATGLSSSSEVEVFVSSSRPSVYCPLEVVVEEGSTVALDCEGVDPLSGRMDYDEDGASIEWEWEGLWGTSTAHLDETDLSSPVFEASLGSAGKQYHYIASMTSSASGQPRTARRRVTVKITGAGEEAQVAAEASALADKGSAPAITCNDAEVYEATADFTLDCSVTDEPSGAPVGSDYEYVWTPRGDTQDTLLLSAADIASPTFLVPDEVAATTTYEYLLTASAENTESATTEVSVTVLNKGALAVVCADPGSVYEGSSDIAFDCSASGAPAGSGYTYAWSARGSTVNTDLLISGTDGPAPTFAVPDALDATTTYEYLLTVSAENAESATAEVTVTVLNRGTLSVVCADPVSVYEGSADIAFDCSASGAPAGSNYTYAWTARGNTLDTSLLSTTDVASPTFYVPDQVDSDETYEYRLTVSTSAENIDPGTFDLTVNVYDSSDLDVVCTDRTVYEGSPPFRLQCTASGGPPGVLREWDWSPATHLTGPRIRTPVFTVPTNVESDMTFTYTATVTAGSMVATGELTVTVLNKGALAVVCADPGSVYEGSEDITFDCLASGAPGDNPQYTYAWTARGNTSDTSLLSAADIASPVFYVPDEVEEDETYEYTLTVSADNAEDAAAEVSVTVLDRAPLAFVDDSISGRVYVFTVGEPITDILLPEATGGLFPYTYTLTPALPNGLGLDDPTRTISGTPLEVSPRTEYTWQATDANTESVSLAFFIEVVPAAEPSPPVAESSLEVAEASSLGATVSTSSLRFGVQSAATEVSLDPMTDQISTHVSGPYHVGRMTLSPGGSEETRENGEMDLSVELASPVVLRREGGIEAASIILSPSWSLAESCEQLSSQAIGGLYTEVTLSDADCRLLRFGGELDLTDVPSGRYTGSLDIILRSGETEETHSVEVDVTVIPAQRVITIGPGGVRFSTSRELPVGLTEEQNLSIYPHVAFLTEGKPHGVFELSNPSLIPLEISVSARFGYTEATENSREVVVEDVSGSHLGDLSQVVDIHPGVLVLMPGEKGLVRYGMQEGALAAMAEKGYAAFFDVVSEPRQYVRSDQMPEEVTGDRTARVTMRVPGVYVPGEGASQLRAALLSISYVGSLSATFLVETQDHPFAGEVVAYDGDGRELGRRETLVYTRSRVRISLDRMPEEGAVFLRFSPRGSGRAPEPASIQWDAPRRDIGAADRDHTRPPATLVQKP